MNFLSNPYTIPQQTNKNEYSTKYELFNWTKIEYIFTHSMKLGIRKFVLFWLDKTILWIYTDWRNVTVQSSLTRLALTFPPAVGQVYSSTLYQNDFGLIWNCTWYNLENKKSVRFGTLFHLSGRRDSNSRPLAWKANALSAELLPQLWRLEFRILKVRIILKFDIRSLQYSCLWGEQDSNLRRRTPADLQSAPVGRFGISPYYLS